MDPQTPTTQTATQRAAADLAVYLRARQSVIWIATSEEARIEAVIADVAASVRYVRAAPTDADPMRVVPAVLTWDVASGVRDLNGAEYGPGESAADPVAMLRWMRDTKEARDLHTAAVEAQDVANRATVDDIAHLPRLQERAAEARAACQRVLCIARDLHSYTQDPIVRRALRSAARELPALPPAIARAIVVVSPVADLPEDLRATVPVIHWPLPDRTEIRAQVERLCSDAGVPVPSNGNLEATIDAAAGLTSADAESALCRSIVRSKTIDPAAVRLDKRAIVARSKALSMEETDPRGLASIGGLAGLKTWLQARRAALTPAARAAGIPAPKGIMLVGPPGTGKSASARAVAAAWGLPLLRLDLGAAKGGIVGQSEQLIRDALRTAEAVAPCVLWIDEIEKGLAGATGGSLDGGVSADALGTLLNWMQEHKSATFVVATANDVTALPPELLRKGRFDDLFFVDLPTAPERAEIIRATLERYGRTLPDADIARVARTADDYTGAELAAAVPEAMLTAYNDGARAMNATDLESAIRASIPLAQTAPEKIAKARAWGATHARPAGDTAKAPPRPAPTTQSAPTSGRALDM